MRSLKYAENLLKISIVLLFLLVCLGSVYAADSNQITLNDNSGEDDFELDDDLDDDWDDDWDEDLDDDFEDDDEDWDEDLDDNESDYSYTDFDYLEFKIISYLDRYGNCSDYNWTESEEFLNEYQIYLINPSNYTLNESSEGYQTYLKIFESITSTFGEYNLTENETAYLKFMVIFYLNHYGNVSGNYTWNESESFANFTPIILDILGAPFYGNASGNASSAEFNYYLNPVYSFIPNGTNFTDVNSTSVNKQINAEVPYSWDFSLVFLVLVCVFVLLLIL